MSCSITFAASSRCLRRIARARRRPALAHARRRGPDEVCATTKSRVVRRRRRRRRAGADADDGEEIGRNHHQVANAGAGASRQAYRSKRLLPFTLPPPRLHLLLRDPLRTPPPGACSRPSRARRSSRSGGFKPGVGQYGNDVNFLTTPEELGWSARRPFAPRRARTCAASFRAFRLAPRRRRGIVQVRLYQRRRRFPGWGAGAQSACVSRCVQARRRDR